MKLPCTLLAAALLAGCSQPKDHSAEIAELRSELRAQKERADRIERDLEAATRTLAAGTEMVGTNLVEMTGLLDRDLQTLWNRVKVLEQMTNSAINARAGRTR